MKERKKNMYIQRKQIVFIYICLSILHFDVCVWFTWQVLLFDLLSEVSFFFVKLLFTPVSDIIVIIIIRHQILVKYKNIEATFELKCKFFFPNSSEVYTCFIMWHRRRNKLFFFLSFTFSLLKLQMCHIIFSKKRTK